MEEFDALMIRVNNVYYGRGKIIMAPELSQKSNKKGLNENQIFGRPGDQLNGGLTTKNRNLATDSGDVSSSPSRSPQRNGLEKDPSGYGIDSKVSPNGKDRVLVPARKPTLTAVVNISSREDRKDPLKPTDESQHSISFKPANKPRKVDFVDRPSEQSLPRPKMETAEVDQSCYHGEDVVDDDSCDMQSDLQSDFSDSRISDNARDADTKVVRTIDRKLLHNPWLSGKIMEGKNRDCRNGYEFKENRFFDSSLIFRDKMKKWSSNGEVKSLPQDSRVNQERFGPDRALKSAAGLNERKKRFENGNLNGAKQGEVILDLNNNEVKSDFESKSKRDEKHMDAFQRNIINPIRERNILRRGEHGSAFKSMKNDSKPQRKEGGFREGLSSHDGKGVLKGSVGIVHADAEREAPSKAERLLLSRSKKSGISKSQGNLNNLSGNDIEDRKNFRNAGFEYQPPNQRQFKHSSYLDQMENAKSVTNPWKKHFGSRMTPAKSLGDLINAFENSHDEYPETEEKESPPRIRSRSFAADCQRDGREKDRQGDLSTYQTRMPQNTKSHRYGKYAKMPDNDVRYGTSIEQWSESQHDESRDNCVQSKRTSERSEGIDQTKRLSKKTEQKKENPRMDWPDHIRPQLANNAPPERLDTQQPKWHQDQGRILLKSKTSGLSKSQGNIDTLSLFVGDPVWDTDTDQPDGLFGKATGVAYRERSRSASNLLDDDPETHQNNGHSNQGFYKDRFVKAASSVKSNVPSFDRRMLQSKSLDQRKMKFEKNDNDDDDDLIDSIDYDDFLDSFDYDFNGESDDERVQQALIDGMTRYAEQKFGRKRAAPKGGKARNAMDDYDIYLRSLKSKVKTSNDRLAGVHKQQREIEEKVKKAEKDVAQQEKTLNDAEDEKRKAEREGRDPVLPSGFIVPQTAKKAAAGAGFANLVMKASAQLWEDKFMAMRAKKGASEDQPEWMKKSKKSDKILVNVGKKPGHKKDEEQKPAWGAKLKKSDHGKGKKGTTSHDDGKQPAFANFSLRKTAKKEEDDDTGGKKVDFKEMEKKSSSSGSRRRRGGDDSD